MPGGWAWTCRSSSCVTARRASSWFARSSSGASVLIQKFDATGRRRPAPAGTRQPHTYHQYASGLPRTGRHDPASTPVPPNFRLRTLAAAQRVARRAAALAAGQHAALRRALRAVGDPAAHAERRQPGGDQARAGAQAAELALDLRPDLLVDELRRRLGRGLELLGRDGRRERHLDAH